MTGIRGRFVLFIAAAAVAPLLVYGALSVRTLSSGTEQTLANGHREIAEQVAARFREYFQNTESILRSTTSHFEGTRLTPWQRERILINHRIDFRELREIAVFDADGGLTASSNPRAPTLRVPREAATSDGLIVTPPTVDSDGLPTAHIAVPLRVDGRPAGWIVAEITLEQLWRAVDAVKLGQHGYAALVDQNGRFIAHGDSDQKRLVANGTVATDAQRQLAAQAQADRSELPRIHDARGTMVVAAARVGVPNWTVFIEQPEWEALAVSRRLAWELYLAIGMALLATIVAGSWWGRWFIRRIYALTTATDALAAGRMDARVSLRGHDELAQLGRQFNTMSDRLVELQDEIRKQERQAMFGRVAAGLVHDLSHPIQTIGNSCKLIQRIFDDAEYRATFRETVERELATVRRVLDDLRNIARPIPLERFPVDINAALRETVETMAPLAETAGLTLEGRLPREPLYIEADLFALGRVHRNLILNAIQATAPGGQVAVVTELHGDTVRVHVRDTGCGIPAERLHAIFEDFVTTKRRGLGLGLAISKKIVEQLGGRISVTSEVGKGTTFVLEFARTEAPPLAAVG
jgi:signal transduction histidine kinase